MESLVWLVLTVCAFYAEAYSCPAGRYFNQSSVRTREYYNVTTPGFFVRDTIFNQKASAMMLGGSIIRNGQEYPHIELVPFDKCCNTAHNVENVNGYVSKFFSSNNVTFMSIVTTSNQTKEQQWVIGRDADGSVEADLIAAVSSGTSNIKDIAVCGKSLYILGTFSTDLTIVWQGDSISVPFNGTTGEKVPFIFAAPAFTGVLTIPGTVPQFFKILSSTQKLDPKFLVCDTSSQQLFTVSTSNSTNTVFAAYDAYDGTTKITKLYRDVIVKSESETANNVLFLGVYNAELWNLPSTDFNSTFISSFSKTLFPDATAGPLMSKYLTVGRNKNYGDALFVDYSGNIGVAGVLDGQLVVSQLVNQSIRYDYPNVTNIIDCSNIVLDIYSIITVVCNIRSGIPNLYSVNYCSSCTPGTYSNPNSDRCLDCPVGTYSTVTRLQSVDLCTPCAVGTYNDQTGRQNCTQCPMGTYNNNTGGTSITSCIPCGPGYYSVATGLTNVSQCIPCPAGSYSNRTISNYCDACPYKTYSKPGSSRCNTCEKGSRYSTTTKACTTCGPFDFCPITTVDDTVNMTNLFTDLSQWTDRQPDPKYIDVIEKWQYKMDYWQRPDVIVNTVTISVGVTALVGIVILLLAMLISKPRFRSYIRFLDVFFDFKRKVKEGESQVKKRTNTGAVLTVVVLIIIVMIVGMNFAHYVIDNAFGLTITEQKQSPDLKGKYSGAAAFYTFDANATNCNGKVRIEIIGFGYANKTERPRYSWGGVLSNDSTACLANWSCEENDCITTGSKSYITFVLMSPGASAYAISYNFSSPYLLGRQYELIDGRVSSGSGDKALRGNQVSVANLMAFYTTFEYSSPKGSSGDWSKTLQFTYFLPSFLMDTKKAVGLTVTQVSNEIGKVVDSSSFLSENDTVGITLELKFSPSVISIKSNVKTELFVWFGSLASNAGTILAVCGVLFPFVHIFAGKVGKRIEKKQSRAERELKEKLLYNEGAIQI